MSLEDDILKKSLQDLDGQDWAQPTYPSHLVPEYHRLRRVPLGELTVDNLRLLIGQEDNLEYLIPLALKYLLREPWVSGDLYDGDLLKAVLTLSEAFWQTHPE